MKFSDANAGIGSGFDTCDCSPCSNKLACVRSGMRVVCAVMPPASITCRNPTLAKCGGEAQHLEKVGNLESSGTPECSELNSKGQNTSHWGVLGVIGKVLKRRYRKRVEDPICLTLPFLSIALSLSSTLYPHSAEPSPSSAMLNAPTSQIWTLLQPLQPAFSHLTTLHAKLSVILQHPHSSSLVEGTRQQPLLLYSSILPVLLGDS